MSICSGPPAGICVRLAAVAVPPGDVVDGTTGPAISGSRISAPSPLPKAFLAIRYDLLCKVRVCFCPSTMNVVEVNRLAVARCLRKANVSRYDGLKYLAAKKASKIRRHLFR